VLVTGHTGFKGSWLALRLHALGADVHGFASPPPMTPSLFELTRLGELVASVTGDVRDLSHRPRGCDRRRVGRAASRPHTRVVLLGEPARTPDGR
jgi:nucleoside-diphosphate-sugar epimerase